MKLRMIFILLLVFSLSVGGVLAQETELELTETVSFVSADFGVTVVVNYPEGWVAVDDEGAMTIASSQAVIDKMDADDGQQPEEGDLAYITMAIPDATAAAFVGDGLSSASLLEAFSGLVFADETVTVDVSALEEIEIDGSEGAMISGTLVNDKGITLGVVLLVKPIDGAYGLVVGTGYAGDMDYMIEMGTAILNTVMIDHGPADREMEEIELSENYEVTVEGLGTITADYAEDWVVEDLGDGTIQFYSAEGLSEEMNAEGVPVLEAGEWGLSIQPVPAEFAAFLVQDGEEISTMSLVSSFANLLIDSDETITIEFSELEELVLGEAEVPAALVTGEAVQGEDASGVVIMAIEVVGGYSLLIGLSHVDEIDMMVSLMAAVGQSINITVESAG